MFQRFVRLIGSAIFFSLSLAGQGALQFDVFLGYDGVIPEANWFPLACEIKNDGPPFYAVIEISAAQFNQGQTRRIPLELPTETFKRVVIPVFSSSRYASRWNIRLLDEKGKIRAEQLNVSSRRQTFWETELLGSFSRTPAGTPVFPDIKVQQPELQPAIARLRTSLFPDNPIALEGLTAIYLNSEIALELKDGQVKAINGWLQQGGHLIVGVEQIGDVNGNPWLRSMLPCELTGLTTVKLQGELQSWVESGRTNIPAAVTPKPNKKKSSSKIKSQSSGINIPNLEILLQNDALFDESELSVATGKLTDGRALLSSGGTPLVIEGNRGRGRITVLMFSPEREPFLSWKNRPWFWAKVNELPQSLFESSDYNRAGGWSIDGLFGALVDSKQVRKLPFTWLLFLLVAYLLVIGPFDQFWLKKINRQMLTWITFPIYVLGFSALIYFIGFRLRAGDSEWNEIHLVDILPNGAQAILRGRTYASLYSPSNTRYPLKSEQPFAALRGEFLANWGNGEESGQDSVIHHGNNFDADVYVPVWTSQLYVNDWLQPAPPPLIVENNGSEIKIENHLNQKILDARLVVNNKIYELGGLAANEKKGFKLTSLSAMPLPEFVRRHSQFVFKIAQQRRSTFGQNEPAASLDPVTSSMAASFFSQMTNNENIYEHCIAPAGFDLAPLVEKGDWVLLAWLADYSPTSPLHRFTPRRFHRNTLLRLVIHPTENSKL